MEESYCYHCDAVTESEFDKFPDAVFFNDQYFDACVTFCVQCKNPKNEESWFE